MVQRCAYCGALIFECFYDAEASVEDLPGQWEPNDLIFIEGPEQGIVPYEQGDDAPEGWCGTPDVENINVN